MLYPIADTYMVRRRTKYRWQDRESHFMLLDEIKTDLDEEDEMGALALKYYECDAGIVKSRSGCA